MTSERRALAREVESLFLERREGVDVALVVLPESEIERRNEGKHPARERYIASPDRLRSASEGSL